MKYQTKFLALFLAFLLFVTPLSLPVHAETANPEDITAEQAATLVEAIALHVSAYTRYEDITTRSLYQEAVKYLLQENPNLYHKILKGMLESIDEHSEYYTAEEAVSLNESVTGEVTGIGVTLDFSGGVALVTSVIPDTPAERAGLRVGDILYRADGDDLSGMNSESILQRIRGEAGSALHLEVDRNGIILTFDIVRELIVGTSITTEIYQEDDKKLMVISVYGFVKNTAEKFAEALGEAKKAGITNLIIDLRDNGGGLLDQAIQMADLLIPEGKTITTEDHKVPLFNQVYKGSKGEKDNYNILLLLNGYSASATEVFAAALRQNDLATILGTKSYGKGSIQSLVPLQTGGMVKYTVGYYLTPNGDNINGLGLTPDIFVENQRQTINPEHFGNFDYAKVYQVGDNGSEVLLAKKMLHFLNLYQGEINETYDRDLYYAVHAFQQQVNIFPYGVLDLTTQINLYNYMGRATKELDTQMAEAFRHFDMTPPEE